MNDLLQGAHHVCDPLSAAGLPHCIIGGLANFRWGRQRFTRDVDLTVYTGFGVDEERTIDLLLQRCRPRRPDAADFARMHRVLLLETDNGIGIDVSLGGLPYERGLVDRATSFDFGDGRPLPTCSAEDLIVLKAFADRPQDWVDIDGVVMRQGADLRWSAVFERIAPLAELKDEPRIVERLRAIRDAGRA